MTAKYSDVNIVIYGTCGLFVNNVTPVKTDATIKQTLGKRIAKHNIPGRSAQDWRLELSGMIYGTATETKKNIKAKLISLHDGTKHHYSDGEHIGSFAIENEGLTFDDSGEKVPTHYSYSLSLIQWEGS